MEPTIFSAAEDNTQPENTYLSGKELQRLAFANEQYYRQVLTTLPAAIYTVDASGAITFYNHKAAELWGRAPVPGKEYWCGAQKVFQADGFTVIPTDQLPILLAVKQGISVTDQELVIERPDGSRRWVHPHIIPLFDANGTITGALNMIFDITDRHTSENALSDKEGQLRHATEAANLGTFSWDLRDDSIHFSDSMANIFGKQHATEITHDLLKGAIHPDDRIIRDQAFENAFETGSLFYIVRLQLEDDEQRWIRVNGRMIFDAEGKPERMHGLAIDITEQKNTEQALRESEARLRLAIDSAEMGTWALDLQTDRLQPSDRYRDILGTDEHDEWAMEDLLRLIHVNDRQTIHLAMRHAIQDGRLDFEVRLIRPDGHLRWIKVNGTTLYNEQHQAVRMIGTVMNITDQRRARRELEATVQARTKALQETNELLEKSNNALAQFAYIASHDLQEPLRKIRTFADLLGRNLHDAPTAEKYLEKIVSSAQRMSALIQDVLNYSRLEKTGDEAETVDLTQTLEAVLSDFELLISQKQAVIHAAKLPVVKGVGPQLHQLFSNLVGNALKFCEGEPVLEIGCRVVEGGDLTEPAGISDQPYYEFTFTDNGIGFDPAYATQIFVIFQRLNNRNSFGGTGIGLALCKKIVENHGGYITARGAEGKGATFTVLLPVGV